MINLDDLHFTICGLDGHNLTMDKELPNGYILAKCKVCNQKIRLHLDNNKAL